MSEYPVTAPEATSSVSRRLTKSSIILWLLAPVLLLLSSVRPTFTRSERAAQVPTQLGPFKLQLELEITPEFERLLGTRDVTWREYVDAEGHEMYLTAVFHDSNWKSLHPPHICIRGSGFNISVDENHQVDLGGGRQATIGRLVATRQDNPVREWVSYYAFVGQDFITPSYAGFYFEHAVLALFRQATPGFLMRIEGFADDGLEAAEARCLDMFRRFLPVGEGLIQLK